ncbi:hypothetical protein SMF913_10372 [Streptomyces malaysiensis]|uniref:Uncharacterized protein n=1 Tax=Streptomyces malaysiensis TaxID=92644 RepID=A0A2J7Z242_STRMQ|nr:hypothetical protein SMF913_10372 [Streptomyces malaysiensis]
MSQKTSDERTLVSFLRARSTFSGYSRSGAIFGSSGISSLPHSRLAQSVSVSVTSQVTFLASTWALILV